MTPSRQGQVAPVSAGFDQPILPPRLALDNLIAMPQVLLVEMLECAGPPGYLVTTRLKGFGKPTHAQMLIAIHHWQRFGVFDQPDSQLESPFWRTNELMAGMSFACFTTNSSMRSTSCSSTCRWVGRLTT